MTFTKEINEAIRVGAGMANILFNVSQNEALPLDVREAMKDHQRQWDSAWAALTVAPPAPQTRGGIV